MTETPPVIEIRDLHKSYGELEVLKGVDMVAPKGHVVSLIGSSGSGKSTLLRCANLLEDSQSGEILFEGEPIKWRGTGLDPPPRRRQASHPYPHKPFDGFPAVQPLVTYDGSAERDGGPHYTL